MSRLLVIGFLISVAALSSSPTPPGVAGSIPVQGDADCNGQVTATDVTTVLATTADFASSACIAETGDTDCNGTLAPSDALPVLRHLAGINVSGNCTQVGAALAGRIVINEVFFRPPSGELAQIEFANNGRSVANPSGLVLKSESGQTTGIGDNPLAPGGFFTMGIGAFVDPDSGYLELYDGDTLLDRVAWGPGQPDAVPLGVGSLAAGPADGMSIGRYSQSTAIGPEYWAAYAPGIGVTSAPNPPVGVTSGSPLDGAILSAGEVAFTWYPVSGADTYHLQVSTDEVFTAIFAERQTTTPTSTVSLGSGIYYWRVTSDGISSPARALVIDGASQAAAPASNFESIQLGTPYSEPRKDTAMLLLENENPDGDYRWDSPHPGLDPADNTDSLNSFFAAVASVSEAIGGGVSQDRLAFEAFKDRFAGPERDLLYRDTIAEPQGIAAMLYAFGGALESRCSTNSEEMWDFLKESIDSGDPLLGVAFGHAVAIDGYSTSAPGGGPAVPERSVRVIDPFVGPYDIDHLKQAFSCLWRPTGTPAPADPAEAADSDGDGMVDFDETNRFGTNPQDDDTDGDGLTDKADVASSVLDPEFGYAREWNSEGGGATFPVFVVRGRDWDRDGAPSELDCDSDNDGEDDGDDPDDWSAPPTPTDPVACGPGIGTVTLSWNADATFDMFLLPDPAGTEDEAWEQAALPGFEAMVNWWCIAPPEFTNRYFLVDDVQPSTRYVGVSFWGPCGLDPHTLSFTLTVRLADGTVQNFSDTLTVGVDSWRLYGPFDLSGPPSP